MYDDVYSSPEKHGLEMVGAVEWDDEWYQFNVPAVWRDKETGQLYWGDDSGCSCPSPFEDTCDRSELTTGSSDELGAHLKSKLAGALNGEAAGQVADLMLWVKR